jgi:hypothetical protein
MTPCFHESRQSENQKSSEKWCFCRSARICSAPVAIRVCRAVLVQVGVVQSSCSRRHRRAVIIVQSSSRSCCRRAVVICRVVVVQSSFLGLGEEGGREGGRAALKVSQCYLRHLSSGRRPVIRCNKHHRSVHVSVHDQHALVKNSVLGQ